MRKLVLLLCVCFVASEAALVYPLHQPKPAPEEQNRQLTEKAPLVLPIDGNVSPLAEFWVEASVGPGKGSLFNVSIATARADSFMLSTNCHNCSHANYNQSKDVLPCIEKWDCSVCFNKQCGFTTTIDNSVVQGVILRDEFALGLSPRVICVFGSLNGAVPPLSLSPVPRFGIGGLLGLALPQLSILGGYSVIHNITAAASLPDTFSLCLKNSDPSMSVGVQFNETQDDFSFTEIVNDPGLKDGFYTVGVDSMSSSGVEFSSNEGPATNYSAVIDSSERFTYLDQVNFDNFKRALKATCNTSDPLPGVCGTTDTLFDGYCFQMDSQTINKFPTLNIRLGNNVNLAWNGSGYIFPFTKNGNRYHCLGIRSQTNANNKFHVFGQTFMQNFHIGFDRENRRVGFANVSSCPGFGVPPVRKKIAVHPKSHRVVATNNGNFLGYSILLLVTLLAAVCA